MDRFKAFHAIVAKPYEYAREWQRTSGGKVLGYFCSYAPEEVIYAAGALPLRLYGSEEGIFRADAHLQSYCCSLVRGGLEDVLAGRLAFLDGAVFPHTCDSIQRLSDVWRLNSGLALHADVVLPVKLNTESSRAYLADVLHLFRRELETGLGVEITSDRLAEAAGVYNRMRAGLRRLYALRSADPQAISGSDLHAVVKAATIMDRGVFLEKLESLLTVLATRPSRPRSGFKRVLLAGGLCNLPDVYPWVEAAGATVVWDDFCSGTRSLEGDIDPTGDVLANMARRIVERNACPAKHTGLETRGRHLLEAARAQAADGVIFLFLKFCDPHAFDYPYLREMLDREQIPSILFEIEDRAMSEGQFKTRCEAFVEML